MNFTSAQHAKLRVKEYFSYIKGRRASVKHQAKAENAIDKMWYRQPQPPTISGLALFLKFASIEAFEEYEINGKYADIIKRGRLRIETEYESKLHAQAPTGAIFALKNLGWNERERKEISGDISTTVNVNVTISGPPVASDERDVIM